MPPSPLASISLNLYIHHQICDDLCWLLLELCHLHYFMVPRNATVAATEAKAIGGYFDHDVPHKDVPPASASAWNHGQQMETAALTAKSRAPKSSDCSRLSTWKNQRKSCENRLIYCRNNIKTYQNNIKERCKVCWSLWGCKTRFNIRLFGASPLKR